MNTDLKINPIFEHAEIGDKFICDNGEIAIFTGIGDTDCVFHLRFEIKRFFLSTMEYPNCEMVQSENDSEPCWKVPRTELLITDLNGNTHKDPLSYYYYYELPKKVLGKYNQTFDRSEIQLKMPKIPIDKLLGDTNLGIANLMDEYKNSDKLKFIFKEIAEYSYTTGYIDGVIDKESNKI